MGTEPQQVSVGDIALWLLPREEMTWMMWQEALRGMRRFVRDHHMTYEWDFVIFDISPFHPVEGIVGNGTLRKMYFNNAVRQNGTSTG